MITTEIVISAIIGVLITFIYKVVKFNRECRRRLENYEKSMEVSHLILEVLDVDPFDHTSNFDYAAFFRKETKIYEKMMEYPTDMWKCMSYEDRRNLIKILSGQYDLDQTENGDGPFSDK